MSVAATLPRRAEGSANAPPLRWLPATLTALNRCWEPTASPAVPFSIRPDATSTVCERLLASTLCRYFSSPKPRKAAAIIAVATATATVRCRLVRGLRRSTGEGRLRVVTSMDFSLFREHSHARAESGHVAGRLPATARVEGVDVLDEVADDVTGLRRVVAVALTRVVEAVPVPRPACDVEGREPDDRDGVVAVALERAEWGQEHVDDPGIALRKVGERSPVVG